MSDICPCHAQLRESSTTNSTLRVAVDEMRASLPLLKHQEGDLLLLKREVDHRFMEEASRNVDNIKRIDALSREVRRPVVHDHQVSS